MDRDRSLREHLKKLLDWDEGTRWYVDCGVAF